MAGQDLAVATGNVASGGVASDGGDACAGEVLARVLGEPWLVAAPPFPVATVAPAGQVSVPAHVENGNITVFEHESTALCGRDEGFELNNFSRLMIVAAQIELLERTQQQDVWCELVDGLTVRVKVKRRVDVGAYVLSQSERVCSTPPAACS